MRRIDKPNGRFPGKAGETHSNAAAGRKGNRPARSRGMPGDPAEREERLWHYSEGVSPSREGSKVPTDRLMQRLGIAGYTSEAPLCTAPIEVHTVRVKLSQHIGAPAEAIVKEGDSVTEGSLIGRAPEGKLSANVHASISGKVTAVTPDYIEIQG